MIGDLWRLTRGALNSEILDFLSRSAGRIPARPGATFGKHGDDVRRGDIQWIPSGDPSWEWLWKKLDGYMREANEATFGYDLGRMETIQLATYTPGDHYDWHIDTNLGSTNGNQRKLSLVVQLNSNCHPAGGLELDCCAPIPDLEPGDLVVFPSIMRHRVRPIEDGVRRSLTSWMLGPRWR